MISNVMLEIDGRRALPLRALPYVCGWAVAPDAVVLALRLEHSIRVGGVIQQMAKRRVEIQNPRSLRAYQYLADGTWQPISSQQWNPVEVELCSLTKKLQADEREGADGENHARWRLLATQMLPDDVFVWFDEFERWFEANRPLAIPTDEDVDLWRIEQARLYDGEDLPMVLDEGMTDFDRVGRLDFVILLPAELDGKMWRYGSAAPPAVAGAAASQTASQKRRGRPRTLEKKALAIAVIMRHFADVGVWADSTGLPGSCADLFDACKRIVKQAGGKAAMFGASEDQFRSVLNHAGFHFRPGRTSKAETRVWTHAVPEIAGKIDAKIFTEITHPA